MTPSLAGATAIVTGASSGIGAATARGWPTKAHRLQSSPVARTAWTPWLRKSRAAEDRRSL